jgi:hypothetical protein
VAAFKSEWVAAFKSESPAGFIGIRKRLQTAVAERYRLPAWTPASYVLHKHADRLAAASEASYVAACSRESMRESLGITLEPLADDPLPAPRGHAPLGTKAIQSGGASGSGLSKALPRASSG